MRKPKPTQPTRGACATSIDQVGCVVWVTCSESLFYCFRTKDQVLEDHLLRLIDSHVRFDFAQEKLRERPTGRSSMILTMRRTMNSSI